MNQMTLFKKTLVLALTLVGLSTSQAGFAQTLSPEQPRADTEPPLQLRSDTVTRNLELSAGGQSLSNGYGPWRELTLRGAYGLPGHVLQGEVSALRRFNKDGAYLGISDTYTFNEDWFASLALGAGDGAFYLPRFRADATLFRKFLPDRNLVGSIGVGRYNAPDGHTDNSLSLGLVYYFQAPWILEGGVRMNSSNPGAIRTQQQFVAATWGRNKQDLVTGRYGWGGEGYLTTAVASQLVNFKSDEASLVWRHWFSPRTGVLTGINRYKNPLYVRTGFTVGIFHDF
jgi:YaiO family outer membrane protein